jgi:hypothetical protein
LTTINEVCDPMPGWEKYVEKALPYAEKYDVKMCSEFHRPTTLTTPHVQAYIEFIKKTRTKHFGLNVDFGTFQNKYPEFLEVKGRYYPRAAVPSKPTNLLLLLSYVYCCHGKFNYMDENFEEGTIPYW